MDEIALLNVWQRDELHRGIFAAMRGDPYDEYQATYWKLGWLFYRDSHPPEQDDEQCTLH